MTPDEQAKADAADMLRQDEEIRAFEERLARDIDAFMAKALPLLLEHVEKHRDHTRKVGKT